MASPTLRRLGPLALSISSTLGVAALLAPDDAYA
jgi:hypothetical protein